MEHIECHKKKNLSRERKKFAKGKKKKEKEDGKMECFCFAEKVGFIGYRGDRAFSCGYGKTDLSNSKGEQYILKGIPASVPESEISSNTAAHQFLGNEQGSAPKVILAADDSCYVKSDGY